MKTGLTTISCSLCESHEAFLIATCVSTLGLIIHPKVTNSSTNPNLLVESNEKPTKWHGPWLTLKFDHVGGGDSLHPDRGPQPLKDLVNILMTKKCQFDIKMGDNSCRRVSWCIVNVILKKNPNTDRHYLK